MSFRDEGTAAPAESEQPATPAPQTEHETAAAAHQPAGNMLPGRQRRRFGIERMLMRLVATIGVIGIGVAIGAILASNKVQGWIIGLVVAIESVVLAAILWSSREL